MTARDPTSRKSGWSGRKRVRQKACRREETAAINRLIDSSLDRDYKKRSNGGDEASRDETPGGGAECSRVVRARANFIKKGGRTGR